MSHPFSSKETDKEREREKDYEWQRDRERQRDRETKRQRDWAGQSQDVQLVIRNKGNDKIQQLTLNFKSWGE